MLMLQLPAGTVQRGESCEQEVQQVGAENKDKHY
jgi:hypothetical protein